MSSTASIPATSIPDSEISGDVHTSPALPRQYGVNGHAYFHAGFWWARCCVCKKNKYVSKFDWAANPNKPLPLFCIDCGRRARADKVNAAAREYTRRHPKPRPIRPKTRTAFERGIISNWGTYRSKWRAYGISCLIFQQALAYQKMRCAICETSIAGNSHIDHDHVSLKFRGLLCPTCNCGLGQMYDSLGNMLSAIGYLQTYRTDIRYSRGVRKSGPNSNPKWARILTGLLAKQGDKCAVCFEKGSWQIDHDHDTGLVRGVLCRQCNLGIGSFRDSQELLRKAIAYLDNPPAYGIV